MMPGTSLSECSSTEMTSEPWCKNHSTLCNCHSDMIVKQDRADASSLRSEFKVWAPSTCSAIRKNNQHTASSQPLVFYSLAIMDFIKADEQIFSFKIKNDSCLPAVGFCSFSALATEYVQMFRCDKTRQFKGDVDTFIPPGVTLTFASLLYTSGCQGDTSWNSSNKKNSTSSERSFE